MCQYTVYKFTRIIFATVSDRERHRRIKRQKGRQRSPLIFWLFDAAGRGGRGYGETSFKKRLMEI